MLMCVGFIYGCCFSQVMLCSWLVIFIVFCLLYSVLLKLWSWCGVSWLFSENIMQFCWVRYWLNRWLSWLGQLLVMVWLVGLLQMYIVIGQCLDGLKLVGLIRLQFNGVLLLVVINVLNFIGCCVLWQCVQGCLGLVRLFLISVVIFLLLVWNSLICGGVVLLDQLFMQMLVLWVKLVLCMFGVFDRCCGLLFCSDIVQIWFLCEVLMLVWKQVLLVVLFIVSNLFIGQLLWVSVVVLFLLLMWYRCWKLVCLDDYSMLLFLRKCRLLCSGIQVGLVLWVSMCWWLELSVILISFSCFWLCDWCWKFRCCVLC